MKHFCNPLNVPYHYQFVRNPHTPAVSVYREAADPSVIFYLGKYWLFPSMNLSVWVSGDLVHWDSLSLPDDLPLYGYAPDARVADGMVYLTACDIGGENCAFYRTRDILHGPWERIPMPFAYKDPNLFQDDDGRLYLYFGCSARTPLQGVELDRNTLQPMGEPVPLISSNAHVRGYERTGEDHSNEPLTDAEAEERMSAELSAKGKTRDDLPPGMESILLSQIKHAPYIEGVWMTNHKKQYYLQYAFSGTEYNVYGDGVFVSDRPLGPFVPAKNNPYSYAPGGFLPGAGHGSTVQDVYGNWWHAATERVSVNHNFERRVGLWRAGFDDDGELFCNQRYADWPPPVPDGPSDPWADPEWFPLHLGKAVTASALSWPRMSNAPLSASSQG
ncbi:MAG: family 43 glycosylhydrolase [Oscillibacter sp.]|nr:family 43 glycosylhydrolase [Oscillibacter sp.]